MNVLAIGNSFSTDATRYLHSIARAADVKINVVNLYIGGCSLERHYRNMLSGGKVYDLQYNGVSTGFFVSLEEALLNREWDVVTLQQASPLSTNKDSFMPYISALFDYVHRCVPKVKIYLHETWAYESGSPRLKDMFGLDRYEEMLKDVKSAYGSIYEALNFDGMIPSGELLGELLSAGIERVHRDGYHASYGLGRYALGLLWFRMLTGRTVSDNSFCDLDEPVSEREIEIAKSCVDGIAPQTL